MPVVLFLSLSVLFLIAISLIFSEAALKGRWTYGIYFLVIYFPIYTVYLSLAYISTESVFLIKGLQFLKDLFVVLIVLLFIIYQKNIFKYPIRLTSVDKLFLSFLSLAFFFLLAPIGDATFADKAFYFKGMLIPALVYFLGRNTFFDNQEAGLFFKLIFGVVIIGFLVNIVEVVLDIHFQSITGYAAFNEIINRIEPTGNFGLSWTFETQSATKRLASIYSDPLELSSSVLMGFSAGLIFFLTSKREVSKSFLFVITFALISLILASSRSSFASFFVMLFFIAITFRLYRLVLLGLGSVLSFVVFIVFFASDDFYYFVIDTLTFQNLSSVGHLVEWLVALDGMVANPLGVGLAMSGNSGSVTEELRIGGENQYLIYGVQLGWLGMIIYIFLLGFSIFYGFKVFRATENVMTARIAFTGAATKTGLLLPLFTSNAEMFMYVSWISWWMIGYAMKEYSKINSREA